MTFFLFYQGKVKSTIYEDLKDSVLFLIQEYLLSWLEILPYKNWCSPFLSLTIFKTKLWPHVRLDAPIVAP
jgi:hypothetical protein